MKLYISNRAEIASRVIRSAKKLGIETSVGFAAVDKDLPFVREATKAKCINTEDPRQAYLDPNKVIETAKLLGATHVHPGYGFLSENPEFVDQVHKEGLEFIGPPSDSMRKLGDKIGSREFLGELGVPMLPSYQGEDQSEEKLLEELERLGLPLLIKPSAGGGGKGMFKVFDKADFLDALSSSKRIAQASFGDSRVFLERFVSPARHVEVQILADGQGQVLVVGDRECSLQRNHQKIIEEAPCAFLSDQLREKIYDYSERIARAVNYKSAGTVEWIWDGADGIYFLEVNTRLQVEHPVTEKVTGWDLVAWQLRIAQGEALPEERPDFQGHSIEARICAEDPGKDFMPTGGKIHRLQFPDEARVDFGFSENTEVSGHFDSMLGKLISYAPTRDEARQSLIRILQDFVILGPKTNRAYLLQLLREPAFASGRISTELVAQKPFRFDMARGFELIQRLSSEEASPRVDDEEEELDIYSPWGRIAGHSSKEHLIEDFGDKRYFYFDFDDWSIKRPKPEAARAGSPEEEQLETDIRSPMPAKIIEIKKQEGDSFEASEVLMILEAMKMEHKVKAPKPGRVKSLRVKVGQQLPPDEPMMELEFDEESAS